MNSVQLYGFFEYLKSEGFEYRIDDFIHVDRILKRLAPEDLGNLKYILAPLIVRSGKEQAEFYKLFDRYFQDLSKVGLHELHSKQKKEEQNPFAVKEKKDRKKKKIKLVWASFFAVVFIGLAIFSYYKWGRKPEPPSQPPKDSIASYYQRISEFAELEINPWAKPTLDQSKLEYFNHHFAAADSLLAKMKDQYFIEYGDEALRRYSDLHYEIGRLSRELHALEISTNIPRQRTIEESYQFIEVLAKKYIDPQLNSWLFESLDSSKSYYELGDFYMAEMELPYDLKFISNEGSDNLEEVYSAINKEVDKLRNDLFRLEDDRRRQGLILDITKADIQFYLILLILVIFGLYEFYLFQNQSFFAALVKGRKPEFFWQFKLSALPKIRWDPNMNRAAQFMRKRIKTEDLEFDIESTIKETVNHGGSLELVYKQRSKPPEYLILIDRSSINSHQSSYFSFLSNSFSENDIFIHKFYYSKNFTSFWSDVGKENNYSLDDLIKLFPNCRLLIFGTSHELLNSRGSGLNVKAVEMEAWKERAILTPRPSAEWDYKENTLSSSFNVLPATSTGMLELVDQLEEIQSTQLDVWKYEIQEKGFKIPKSEKFAIQYLKRNLGDKVFEWVCMCAVFPQLYWDLTLYIGREMFLSRDLLTQENLQKLLKLEWFEKGVIPENFRVLLLAELSETRLNDTRVAIINQMRNHPPEFGSDAYDEYKLNLMVNELAIKGISEDRKRAVKQELNSLRDRTDLLSYTEIKSTASSKMNNMLDFLLPPDFRSKFKGVGARKTIMRLLLTLVLIVISALLLAEPIASLFKGEFKGLGLIWTALGALLLWRFVREKSLLNSFEKAFYWTLYSVGLYFLIGFYVEQPLEREQASVMQSEINFENRVLLASAEDIGPAVPKEKEKEKDGQQQVDKRNEDLIPPDQKEKEKEGERQQRIDNRNLDDDGDGILNKNDLEPNTPRGNNVDRAGRTIEDSYIEKKDERDIKQEEQISEENLNYVPEYEYQDFDPTSEGVSPWQDKRILFILISYILMTSFLIFKLSKNKISGVAVSVFWVNVSCFLLIIPLIIIKNLDDIISLPLGIVLLLSIVFIVFRNRKQKITDPYEWSVYWLGLGFIALLFLIGLMVELTSSNLSDYGAWIIIPFIVAMVGIMNKLMKFSGLKKTKDFMTESVFSIYWFGIFLAIFLLLESLNVGNKGVYNYLFIYSLLSISILINKKRMGKGFQFESTIYTLIAGFCWVFVLSENSSTFQILNKEVGLVLSGLIFSGLLIYIFRIRKFSIHVIELLLIYTGYMFWLIFMMDNNIIDQSKVWPISIIGLLLIIVYRIRANALARASVRV